MYQKNDELDSQAQRNGERSVEEFDQELRRVFTLPEIPPSYPRITVPLQWYAVLKPLPAFTDDSTDKEDAPTPVINSEEWQRLISQISTQVLESKHPTGTDPAKKLVKPLFVPKPEPALEHQEQIPDELTPVVDYLRLLRAAAHREQMLTESEDYTPVLSAEDTSILRYLAFSDADAAKELDITVAPVSSSEEIPYSAPSEGILDPDECLCERFFRSSPLTLQIPHEQFYEEGNEQSGFPFRVERYGALAGFDKVQKELWRTSIPPAFTTVKLEVYDCSWADIFGFGDDTCDFTLVAGRHITWSDSVGYLMRQCQVSSKGNIRVATAAETLFWFLTNSDYAKEVFALGTIILVKGKEMVVSCYHTLFGKKAVKLVPREKVKKTAMVLCVPVI